jgi:hypothetical protein
MISHTVYQKGTSWSRDKALEASNILYLAFDKLKMVVNAGNMCPPPSFAVLFKM